MVVVWPGPTAFPASPGVVGQHLLRAVFVDRNGLCYCTDWSGAGLYIMEYMG